MVGIRQIAFGLWLAGCLFAVEAVAFADAPPPAPRDAAPADKVTDKVPAASQQPAAAKSSVELPPPATNQRGQRLRNLGVVGLQLLDSFTNRAAGNGATATGKTPAGGLDFKQINETLATVVRPILAGDARLESFQVIFDPAITNLEKDVLRLSADAGLRRSAWSPSSTRLHIEGGATANLGAAGGPTAEADAQILLFTDVPALADWGLKQFKSRQANAANGAATVTGTPVQQEMREYLVGLDHIASLEDVVDVFQHLSSIQFRSLNENVHQLKQELDRATDDESRQRLAAQLLVARTEREKAQNIRTRIERDNAGRVQSLSIAMALPAVDATALRTAVSSSTATQVLQVERFEILVTEREIRGSVVARINKGVETYALLKPIIVGTLERIQARDPATIAAQQTMLRGALERVMELLGQ